MPNQEQLANEAQEKILQELKFIAEHIILVENLTSAILSKLNGERGPRILTSATGRERSQSLSNNPKTLN